VFAQILNGADVVDQLLEGDVIESIRSSLMFSERVPSDSRQNRLAEACGSATANGGRSSISRLESDPRRLFYPRSTAPLADPRGLDVRAGTARSAEARQAVSRRFRTARIDACRRSHGADGEHERSVFAAFQAALRTGRRSADSSPSYPLFDHLTRLDAVTRSVRPRIPHAMVDRLSRASSARSANDPRMLLVSPNNPTGQFVELAELGRDRSHWPGARSRHHLG
jgi:hypothetical protein